MQPGPPLPASSKPQLRHSKVGDVLPIVVAMQLLYFVPGVVIAAFAGVLWLTEYRGQLLHMRPPSPARTPADQTPATRSRRGLSHV
jgi:hypothetical protein